jgi:hypothetical protein
MSLKSVLRSFAVDFDIIRQPAIARVSGRVIDAGEAEDLKGRGSFQPATAKDLQRLPEGQRTNAVIAIFTDCELLTGDAPNTRPDHVISRGRVYNGVRFEIQSVEPWPVHNKYLAIKVGQ